MQWNLLCAGLAVSVIAGGGMTVDHLQVAAVAEQHQADAHEIARGRVLPQSPQAVLRTAHAGIARDDPALVCQLMDPAAEAAFARAHDTTGCADAALRVSAALADRARYRDFESEYSSTVEVTGPDQATVNGCAVYWSDLVTGTLPDAGPKIGTLHLRRVAGHGWEITGFQPCAAPSPPAEPPTPPSAPASGSEPEQHLDTGPPPPQGQLLPSYPPQYIKLLTRAIANRNGGICGTFSDAARQQFAEAHNANTCQEAVQHLADQVTNTAFYAAGPVGEIPTSQTGGATVVNGCTLAWRSLTGAETPGPPAGTLELRPQPGTTGYYISGYHPC